MKKTFHTLLFIFSLLSFSLIYSQDLTNLDNKFGFKKFKLETPYNLYSKQLKFHLKGYDNVMYYEYVGNDIGIVFGGIVKKINLGFYNQKLYTISIELITDDTDDKRIQRELIGLFGYQKVNYSASSVDTKYDWAIAWSTNKTYLQANKVSCTNEYNPCRVEIFLYSQKLRRELNNNQF